MNNIYTPDGWVLLKIESSPPYYKVFGSWHSSYDEGEQWKINSGVVSVGEEGSYYLFKGSSGSVYKCHKDAMCVCGSYNEATLECILKDSTPRVSVVRDIEPLKNNKNWGL